MLYTPSHAELAQHPKTRKLARLLGCSIPTAIGHLHLLWHFALKYAPDGDLARFDNDEVADGCMWEGDASDLYDALRSAGWINDDATIHDWQDYGGKAIKQKEDNAERQQRWRDRHKTVSQPSPNKPVTVTSPLYNALEEKRIDQKKEEERIDPPTPQSGGGGATAPRKPAIASPVRAVPKPKDEPPKVNPWWDALVEGIGVTPATSSERSKYGKVVGELRSIDATPDEIRRRCANYRERWPGIDLTPTALLEHWSRLDTPPPEKGVRAAHTNGQRPTGRTEGMIRPETLAWMKGGKGA